MALGGVMMSRTKAARQNLVDFVHLRVELVRDALWLKCYFGPIWEVYWFKRAEDSTLVDGSNCAHERSSAM